MGLRFENPPLIEILAELRWNLQGVQQQAGGALSIPARLTGDQEEFFMRFGGAIASDGCNRIERIVPPQFPSVPGQVVYRFRHQDPAIPTLYQIGAGVFSANSTPPYKTWEEFKPFALAGVSKLLSVRSQSDRDVNFSSVSLRYIDAFKGDLLDDFPTRSFLSEILGITIELPKALVPDETKPELVKPHLNLAIPIGDFQLTFVIGEGVISNESAILMDTIVSTTNETNPSIDDVEKALSYAHDVIHNIFVGLTEKLHPKMGLIRSEE